LRDGLYIAKHTTTYAQGTDPRMAIRSRIGGASFQARCHSAQATGLPFSHGGSPPMACMVGISCLYFTCILCLSLTVSLVSRCIPVSSHFAADPLDPAVSHCIQLYPYVSSCIQLYLLYPAVSHVSHRLENGIWSIIHSRGGLRVCIEGEPENTLQGGGLVGMAPASRSRS